MTTTGATETGAIEETSATQHTSATGHDSAAGHNAATEPAGVRVVARPGGVRIPYTVLGPGAERRLLFAHSLTASGLGAGPLFQPLLDAGWSVLTLDQRGHGRATPVDSPGGFALAEMGADLLAVLDDAGWETAWFAGGSLGAATALAAAAQAPDRVEGLALLAPAFGREPNPAHVAFAEIAAGFRTDGMPGGLEAWSARFRANGATDEAIAAHSEQIRRLDPASLACLLETLPSWTVARELDVVATLDVPVVVMAWDGDDVHPMRFAAEAVDAARHGVLHPIDTFSEGFGPAQLFALFASVLPPAPGRSRGA